MERKINAIQFIFYLNNRTKIEKVVNLDKATDEEYKDLINQIPTIQKLINNYFDHSDDYNGGSIYICNLVIKLTEIIAYDIVVD